MTQEQVLNLLAEVLPHLECLEEAGYKHGVIADLRKRTRKAIEAAEAGSHAHRSEDGNATAAADATDSIQALLLASVRELHEIVFDGMTADHDHMIDALKRARLAVKAAGGKDL